MTNQFPVKKLQIAGNDISEYVVFCQDKPQTGVEKAINTLVEMIARAVGCRLPVVTEGETQAFAGDYKIVIGSFDCDPETVKEARESLKAEGYGILSVGNCLYITGGDDRGVSYGVYTFLEDYVGVRFCSSKYTVIHQADVLNVPGDLAVTFNPHFEYRNVFWYDYIQNPDFAAKNKMNVAGGNWTDKPGSPVYAGIWVHSLGVLNGAPAHVVNETQPCLTDETVYQRILGNVKKWLRENPDSKIISISQNDSNPDDWSCKCEKCRAINEAEGTPMGNLLAFVNRIADDLKEEYPDVVVDTLAYQYTRKPPKHMIPRDNVCIRLCSIEYSFSRALNDPASEKNMEFAQILESWGKVCKRLYIWDYTTNFAFEQAPFPNLHILWDNVRLFKENNVRGVLEQGNYQSYSTEFEELRGYLLAKLLWNPDMTKEGYFALMDEFLQDYYGEGWRYVREYIDKTSKKAADHVMWFGRKPYKYLPIADENGRKDLTFINEMTALWENALASATNEEHRRHVRKSMLQNEFYSLYMNFDNQVERHEAFFKGLEEFGVTRISEWEEVPKNVDYTKDIRNYITGENPTGCN